MRPRWHLLYIALVLFVISVCSGTMLKQDIPEHNRKHARNNPYAAPIPPRAKRQAPPLIGGDESLGEAMKNVLNSVLNPESDRVAREAAPVKPNVATNKPVPQQPAVKPVASSAKTNPTPTLKASTKPMPKTSPTPATKAKPSQPTPPAKKPSSPLSKKPTPSLPAATKPKPSPATKPKTPPSTKPTPPPPPPVTTPKPPPATQPSTKPTSTSTSKTSPKPTTTSTTPPTPPPLTPAPPPPSTAAPPQPRPQPQPQPQPQPPPRNTKTSKKPIPDSGEVTPDPDDDNWEDVTDKPKRPKQKHQSTSDGGLMAAASEKAPLLNMMGKLSIVAILIEIVLIIAFNGVSIFLFIKTRMNEKANAGKLPAGNNAGGAKTPGAVKKKGGTKSGLTKSKSNSKDSLSKKGSGSKSKSFSLMLPGKKHPPAKGAPTPTPTASNTSIKFPPGKQPPGRKNSAGARPPPSTAVNAASSVSRVGAGADPDVTTSDIWATTEGGTWVSTVSTVTDGRTAAYEYAEIFGVQDSEHFEADTLEGDLSTTVIGFDSDIEAVDESGDFSNGDDEDEFSDYSSE
uniref:WH1 domain-containing protein n=1 Tax=Panagrellus redivivus TaxID=6233 RepID=A0A7E4VNI9_PANRE